MGEEVEERLLTADELNAACEVVEFGIRAKYQYAELRIDLAAKLLREVARLEAANESLRASLTRAEAAAADTGVAMYAKGLEEAAMIADGFDIHNNSEASWVAKDIASSIRARAILLSRDNATEGK